MVLYQQKEDIKRLAGERQSLPSSEERVLFRLQPKVRELIKVPLFLQLYRPIK